MNAHLYVIATRLADGELRIEEVTFSETEAHFRKNSSSDCEVFQVDGAFWQS